MWNKKIAGGYGDRGVYISEKGFDGKRNLEEVLGSKCSTKCCVRKIIARGWDVAVHIPGWVWLGLVGFGL